MELTLYIVVIIEILIIKVLDDILFLSTLFFPKLEVKNMFMLNIQNSAETLTVYRRRIRILD